MTAHKFQATGSYNLMVLQKSIIIIIIIKDKT